MADLRIAVELAGKDTGATSTIKNVVGALGGIQGAVASSGGALGGFLDIGSKIGLLSVGFQGLQAAVGAVSGGLVSGNSQMETYETQLGTLLGSTDKAKASLATLAQFGASTPFELPEIVRAEKVLLGFGLTGEKVFKLTGQTAEQFRSTVGDVAAGTGQRFEDIALTFGKFSAGATGEAISRFQEMGVATREQMAELGIQFSKSGELLSPLPVAMEAITKIAQSKFGGGMEKLSKTAEGQMSTLADNFGQLKNRLAAPIFDVFKNAVSQANELIGTAGFQAAIQKVSEILASGVQSGLVIAVDLFNRLSAAVTGMLPTFLQVAERFGTFFGSLMQGQTLAQSVNAAFGDLIPASLNPILDAVDAAFKAITTTIGQVISVVKDGGLVGLWEAIGIAMSDFGPTGERLGQVFDSIKAAISALIPDPIEQFVTNLMDIGRETAGATDYIKGFADIINTVTQFVEDHIAVQAALVTVLSGAAIAWGTFALVNSYHAAVATATGIMKAAQAAQLALNIAIAANPIGLVIAALAALAIGLTYAYNNSEEFREIVDATWATVSSGVAVLWEVVKLVAGSLVDAFKTAVRMFNDFRDIVDSTLRTVQSTVQTIFSSISATITGIHNTIYQTISTIWNQIPADIREDLALIYNEVARRFDETLGKIRAVLSSIWDTINTVWSEITGFVETALTNIGSVISSQFDSQQTKVSTATGEILRVVTAAWESIKTAIATKLSEIVGAIGKFSTDLISSLSAMAGEAMVTAEKIGGDIIRGIASGMGGLMGWLMGRAADMARDVLNSMKQALGISSPSKEAEYLGEEIVNGLVQGMRQRQGQAITQMEQLSQRIISIGEEADRALREIARRAGNDIGQFNPDMGRKLQAELDRATDVFSEGLAKLGREASQQLNDVTAQMNVGLADAARDATRQITDIIVNAERQIADIHASQSLDKDIKYRRDAFSEQQKLEQEAFREKRDRDKITAARDEELAAVELERKEMLLAQISMAEKVAIDQGLSRRRADAEKEYADALAQQEERKKIKIAEDEFRKQQEQERKDFEERLEQEELDRTIKRIEDERDARIRAIHSALQEKQAAIIKDAEEERLIILANLKKRTDDLRQEYLDRVQEAIKNAGVNIEDFSKKVQDNIKKMTDASIGMIQGLIDKAAELNTGVTPWGMPTTPGGISAPGPVVNVPLPRVNPTPDGRSGYTPGMAPIGGDPFGMTNQPIIKQYNLTVNGNASVDTREEVADMYRRMELVTR